jgi:hypothetical protein
MTLVSSQGRQDEPLMVGIENTNIVKPSNYAKEQSQRVYGDESTVSQLTNEVRSQKYNLASFA